MVNYQQGKIYKIVCNTTGLVYIGSTCELRLSKRISHHVALYKRFLKGLTNYTSSFEILKGECYQIFLLENFPCETSDELRMRERQYIENTDCVNMKSPIFTEEDKRESKKKYSHLNKDKISQINKKYIENNKEKVKKYFEEKMI